MVHGQYQTLAVVNRVCLMISLPIACVSIYTSASAGPPERAGTPGTPMHALPAGLPLHKPSSPRTPLGPAGPSSAKTPAATLVASPLPRSPAALNAATPPTSPSLPPTGRPCGGGPPLAVLPPQATQGATLFLPQQLPASLGGGRCVPAFTFSDAEERGPDVLPVRRAEGAGSMRAENVPPGHRKTVSDGMFTSWQPHPAGFNTTCSDPQAVAAGVPSRMASLLDSISAARGALAKLRELPAQLLPTPAPLEGRDASGEGNLWALKGLTLAKTWSWDRLVGAVCRCIECTQIHPRSIL
jgi:hypothetical protein